MSRLDSRLKTLERRVGDVGREVVFLWNATAEEKRKAEEGGALVVNFKWTAHAGASAETPCNRGNPM